MTAASTYIRASSLPGYPDCPRRSAAKLFRSEVEAAGYALRRLPGGIGAAIGTAVHAGAAATLAEKARSGRLAPEDVAQDAAVASLRESAAEGIVFDTASPAQSDAERQALRMLRVYRTQVAPQIEPMLVEERLEAEAMPGLTLSGQSDVITSAPAAVRDLKTGKMRGAYKPQLGAYALLARSHGIKVTRAFEDFIQRAPLRQPQADAVIIEHDLAAAEVAAASVLRIIASDLSVWRHGDPERHVPPAEPWAFAANPSSKLCSAKWCPAWGSDFCREHAEEK